MKNDIYELPDDIFKFAQFMNYHNCISDLANFAEPEDWSYHNTPSPSNHPILQNYFNNTYLRLAREKKIAFSTDMKYACFDTGLLTKQQREPIYALFCINIIQMLMCIGIFGSFLERVRVR